MKPIVADEDLTTKMNSACQYHDIKVLNHVIASEGYYSFADEELL